MPVERDLANRRGEVVDALNAIDTQTLKALARSLGYGERTLWRYRAEKLIPEARLLPLERALGIR